MNMQNQTVKEGLIVNMKLRQEVRVRQKAGVGARQTVRVKQTVEAVEITCCQISLGTVSVYYGRETLLIDRPELTHTSRVVLTLCDPLSHKGYNLYTDRFSILAHKLDKVGITLTGTVQINRKGLPAAIASKKKQSKGTVCALMVLQWMDKKKISMSTKHTNTMTTVTSRYIHLT